MNIGKAVTYLLNENGLKPADLMRGADISSSYITQLRNGAIKDITLDKAIRIADFFGVSIDEFARIAASYD